MRRPALCLIWPASGLLVSGDEAEQACFTGAVAPDEAYPFARFEHERGLAQYGVVADLVGHGVDGQKRHQRRDYRHFGAIRVHGEQRRLCQCARCHTIGFRVDGERSAAG